jgi:hypothetical protein
LGLVQECRLVEGIRVGEYSAGLVGVELPGQEPISTVAIALPAKLVNAGASDMNRSTRSRHR